MPLNDAKVKNAKPGDKPYRLSDERGMYLEVAPNGGKYWRMAYRFEGKRKLLALGTYPDVGLARARELRDDARRRLGCSCALNSDHLCSLNFDQVERPARRGAGCG